MNTPYEGQIDWLPDFIGEELMRQQELQGNKRDISVFEKSNTSDKNQGGFDWHKTMQRELFWHRVIYERDINLFLSWFKPELEVYDDYSEIRYKQQVIGYCECSNFPFNLKEKIGGGTRFKHAQLLKKDDKAKTELLKKAEELTKQADELLTKATELKAAAKKL